MVKSAISKPIIVVFPVLSFLLGVLGCFLSINTIALFVLFLFLSGFSVFFLFIFIKELLWVKAIKKDLSDVLHTLSRRLGRAISSFGAGDIGFHISRVLDQVSVAETTAVAELLLTGTNDFNSITDNPSQRLCFIGASGYQEGLVAGQNIARLLNGKGSFVCFFPDYNQTNHVLRMKGCVDFLAENFPAIKCCGVFEAKGSPEFSAELLRKTVAKNPDLSLVYITDGHTPSEVGNVIRSQKLNIKMVVYDGVSSNIQMLKEGIVTAVIEQSPYSQTFDAVMHLYNACEAGWRPMSSKMYMEPLYLDISNYKYYWDEAKDIRILRDEEIYKLAKPEPNRSKKQYRFAVLMPQLTGFFAGLLAGIEGAQEALKRFNVSIEVIDLYHNQEEFGSAKYYVPEIQRLIREGYDGFSTSVIDANIIPTINEAVKAGLKVTTFSTEPSNFREIIVNIMDNIKQLASMSQELASAVEQSSRANSQMSTAIKEINEDISQQKNKIDDNDTQLSKMNTMVTDVQSALSGYVELVEKIHLNSQDGDRAIDLTVTDALSLKKTMESIESELLSFNEKLALVSKFAVTIENFSEETNVLAINASIQAARAGNAGKTFSVVAGEIRSLAEKSQNTAENISSIVKDITHSMKQILGVTEKGSSEVLTNIEKARLVQEAFSSIRKALGDAERSIEQINSSVAGVAIHSSTVKDNMSSIDQMSKNSVNRLGEISVSINELSLQSDYLAETANELKAMAEEQSSSFSQLYIKQEN